MSLNYTIKVDGENRIFMLNVLFFLYMKSLYVKQGLMGSIIDLC